MHEPVAPADGGENSSHRPFRREPAVVHDVCPGADLSADLQKHFDRRLLLIDCG